MFPWSTICARDPISWHALDWPTRWDYRTFCSLFAAYLFGDDEYLFQGEPNLRRHPPGGMAVPWHTDAEFGHLDEEVNVWVPLTETSDASQRLWLDIGPQELVDGNKVEAHYVAPKVPIGWALIFPGAVTRHGNRTNKTGVTRQSFDFRLLRARDYRDRGLKTVEYGVPLKVPEYWQVP